MRHRCRPPPPPPLHAQHREADPADICPRPGDPLPQLKLLAELVFPADPFGFPVITSKKAGIEAGHLTESALAAVLVPISDPHIAGASALKRFPGVDDLGRIG